jgi:hypothetical protein
MLSAKPTLVVGDVHGHIGLLRGLLAAEGIIDPDTGIRRRDDCEVVQLGDMTEMRGTAQRPRVDDLACLQLAASGAVDIMLWGNHDRAAFDSLHEFTGFQMPGPSELELLGVMRHRGSLRFAHAAHGALLTHAGLHPAYAHDLTCRTAEQAAAKINTYKRKAHGPMIPTVDAVSRRRSGGFDAGGILWRDHDEPLAGTWPQIYGHSTADAPRLTGDGNGLCVDTVKAGGALTGVWLPSLQMVSVSYRGLADVVVSRSDEYGDWRTL